MSERSFRCCMFLIVGWLGRALMQFETCQSWVAELVPHFGSSSAIWVVNFSHPLHPDPFCRVKGRGFLCWNGLQSVKCPGYLNICCVESYTLCSPNCHPLLLSNNAHCQSSQFKEHAIDILEREKGMSERSFRCCMFLTVCFQLCSCEYIFFYASRL